MATAGPGQGSEFTLRLLLAPDDAAGAERRPGGSGEQPAGVGQQRVLVVDDNRDAADSLGMLLKFLGADAYVVYDGPSALHALPVYRPSVVLLDIGMPGMDGHGVAEQVRQAPEFRDLVLVALTGWGQEEDRRCSKAAGQRRGPAGASPLRGGPKATQRPQGGKKLRRAVSLTRQTSLPDARMKATIARTCGPGASGPPGWGRRCSSTSGTIRWS